MTKSLRDRQKEGTSLSQTVLIESNVKGELLKSFFVGEEELANSVLGEFGAARLSQGLVLDFLPSRQLLPPFFGRKHPNKVKFKD
jgi:hypothetical protein